jgi:uncharacterized membrane protein YedE/YeeE
MSINIEQFTPFSSLAGGVLIGLAAALLILCCGRVAGISGILGGAMQKVRAGERWRLAFLLGLLLAPILYGLLFKHPEITLTTSTPRLIVAGLLVGVGTQLGSGCTSGHGVCGLARFSPRSLIATLTFMIIGFVIATLLGLGL